VKVCVAFIAFDRHRLVNLTLSRVWRFLPWRWKFKVFQDGPIEQSTGRAVGSTKGVGQNLALYRYLKIDVEFKGEHNRGIAHVIHAAECWAFDECGADIAIIIEDDVVISRFFFFAMRQFARMSIANERVGAFSAFGDSSLQYADQFQNRNTFIPMHHRWGYGVTRDFWSKTRSDYTRYLDLMQGYEYRSRPNAAITEFLLRFKNTRNIAHITSQDGVQTALILHHGGFAFMSPVSYAVNIGKAGTHMGPDFFHHHKKQFKGPGGLFPFPLLFSCRALTEQSNDLFNQCVNYQYY
jgi:hypothetical protein